MERAREHDRATAEKGDTFHSLSLFFLISVANVDCVRVGRGWEEGRGQGLPSELQQRGERRLARLAARVAAYTLCYSTAMAISRL